MANPTHVATASSSRYCPSTSPGPYLVLRRIPRCSLAVRQVRLCPLASPTTLPLQGSRAFHHHPHQRPRNTDCPPSTKARTPSTVSITPPFPCRANGSSMNRRARGLSSDENRPVSDQDQTPTAFALGVQVRRTLLSYPQSPKVDGRPTKTDKSVRPTLPAPQPPRGSLSRRSCLPARACRPLSAQHQIF